MDPVSQNALCNHLTDEDVQTPGTNGQKLWMYQIGLLLQTLGGLPLSRVLEQMWIISLFLSLYFSDSGLFGVPLSVLLEQDQKKVPGTKIPLIFQKVDHHKQINLLHTCKSQANNVLSWIYLLPVVQFSVCFSNQSKSYCNFYLQLYLLIQ